jgi:tRNA A37 threonylcarbamoyladenosine modification protein TsaB
MYLLISTENNSHFSLAVGASKIEKVKTIEKPYKQSELLLKTIVGLVKKKKIDGIIAIEGPGGFSALRIGIATANALAFSYKIPVVGVKLKKTWLKLSEEEKVEKVWQSGLKELKTAEVGKWLVPFYDKEPNIT